MFKKNFRFTVLTAFTLFVFMTTAYLPGRSVVTSMKDTAAGPQSADPLWCPSGVAPTPNANGCTKSYPDLYSLVNDIFNGNIPQPGPDGTIWVAQGPDNSPNNIVIDGNTLVTWSTTKLVVQGGWDGVSGSTAIQGVSSFTKYIHIDNWKNKITINAISVSGTSNTGLQVSTTGEMDLKDVSSSGNAGYGAYFDNKTPGNNAGLTMMGTNVFSKNGVEGLHVNSYGAISVDNVTASNNGFGGAVLDNIWGGLNLPITLSGKSVFNSNGYSGLYVEGTGPVTAGDLTAGGNGHNGWGTGVILETLWSTDGSGITVTGKNDLNSNVDDGLVVNSLGPVSVEGVFASGNGQDGANVYNNSQVGNPATDITLDGSQFFKNRRYGLNMGSRGTITVKDVKSGGNGDTGVALSNAIQGGKPMEISIISAESNGNGKDGLLAISYGLISLDSVTGANNQGYGASLNNAYGDTVSDINVSASYFGNNSDNGVRAYSFGTISMDNTKISSNGSIVPIDGAYLDNCRWNGSKCTGSGSIKLDSTSFSSNLGNGLFTVSNGAITISNSLAELNGHNGFSLKNNGNMELYCSQLNDNKAYGIEATLPGTLTLYGVTFSGNALGDMNISGGGSAQQKEYQCG